MRIFNIVTLGAQVFGLLFTLFIFCYINQVIKLKETPLLTKTPDPNQKDSSPSKGSKKDDKKISKKGKSEPHGEKNPHSAGVDNHDNGGFRTPERQENTDLENAPNPSAAQRQE